MQLRRAFWALLISYCIASASSLAGFVLPAGGGLTTIVDNALQFKGRIDYVAPGTGLAAWAGGGLNWEPNAQETQIGPNFNIDVTGKHLVAGHVGEIFPNLLMTIKLPNVVAGGAAVGPVSTSIAHNDHGDWLQAVFQPIVANNRSRLYVQIDHLTLGPPDPIDPQTFDFVDLPEPGGLSIILLGTIAICRSRAARSRR